jgi:hypothetical protein
MLQMVIVCHKGLLPATAAPAAAATAVAAAHQHVCDTELLHLI